MKTLFTRFETEIEGFVSKFLQDIASNELKRPEEVQDFEEAEDQLYIQCYNTSKKYHSMGLDENTIRLVLSKKGIQN